MNTAAKTLQGRTFQRFSDGEMALPRSATASTHMPSPPPNTAPPLHAVSSALANPSSPANATRIGEKALIEAAGGQEKDKVEGINGRGAAGSLEPSDEDQEDERDSAEFDAIAEPPLERGDEPAGSITSRTVSRQHPAPALSVGEKHDVLLLQLSTVSLLAFITLWGVLSRLGLEWIGAFASGQVFKLVWPQIVGCFVMGVVVERKKGLERM